MDLEAVVVERQGWHDRVLLDGGMANGGCRPGASGFRRHDPSGVRRRSRSRRRLLGAGQLVPRRGRPDVIHRLAVRRAEPGEADVSPERLARGLDPRLEVIRPRSAAAAGGLVTGGAMIKRAPNDPAWYKGGLWHDNMPINVPGFWFMSWYDVSVGPNLAAYNYVRRTAKPEVA